MSDINLLPDNLKKKEEKILDQRKNFSNNLEFTTGEKLLKEKGNSKNSFMSAFSGLFSKKQRKISDFQNSAGFNDPIKIEEKPIVDYNKQVVDKKVDTIEIKDNIRTFDSDSLDKINNELNNFKKEIPKEVVLKNNSTVSKKPFENIKMGAKKEIPVNKNNTQVQQIKEVKKKNVFFKSVIDKLFKADYNKKDNRNVNLLPENLNFPSQSRVNLTLISVFLISVIVILMIYFGMILYQTQMNNQIFQVDTKIQEALSKSTEYDSLIKEIEDLKSRVTKIKELLNKHVYWTKFFAELEKNTLPEVTFNSFAGSIAGNLSLAATAPDYYTLARQWAHLRDAKDFVNNVVIDSASISGSQSSGVGVRVSFTVMLDLVDDIFYKKIK